MIDEASNAVSEALSLLIKGETTTARGRFLKLILSLYSITGVLVAAGSVTYAAMIVYNIEIPDRAHIPLGLSVAGVLLTVFSMLAKSQIERKLEDLERNRIDRSIVLIGIFLWVSFEQAARRHLGERASKPTRHLVSQLSSEGAITLEQEAQILTALDIRNRLAHGMSVDLSMDEIKNVFSSLDSITRSLDTSPLSRAD